MNGWAAGSTMRSSMIATSKRAGAPARAAVAAAMESTVVSCTRSPASMLAIERCTSGLSSQSSTLASRVSGSSARACPLPWRERMNGSSKWKRLPLPGVLSTAISPPIRRTSSRQIASPRPVPP